MKHTYINPFTREHVTVTCDSSENAWQELCKVISPSEQLVYVRKDSILEHRIIDKTQLVLYLKIKEGKAQCVKRTLYHHKQRLGINVFEHFKKTCMNSNREEKFDRAMAQVLYDTLNLN